jgi:hypothetical protein
MTTIFKIVAIITLGILLYRVIKDSIQKNIKGYANYDRNHIIGEDATQIFKRYNVDSMHGLSLDGAINWDSHEEEMITWAENEANEIVKLLKKEKYIS